MSQKTEFFRLNLVAELKQKLNPYAGDFYGDFNDDSEEDNGDKFWQWQYSLLW